LLSMAAANPNWLILEREFNSLNQRRVQDARTEIKESPATTNVAALVVCCLLTRKLTCNCGVGVIVPAALGQGFDQRWLHARDVLAHQHRRPPWLAGNDCLIDPMMFVVTAANVAMLEGDDVAARRHRHVVADPDHLGERPVARRGEQSVVEVTTDVAIDREIAGFERAALQQSIASAEAALDRRFFVRTEAAVCGKPSRNPFERGADLIGIDNASSGNSRTAKQRLGA
jgi:hypothetical protein